MILPQSDRLPQGERFDWRGVLLIAPALTGFIAVLNEIHALGPTSPILLGCLFAGVASALLFVRTERRSPSPWCGSTTIQHAPRVFACRSCR